MPYDYDIFVSYKRNTEWDAWVQKHFLNALHAHVKPNYPKLRVFVDNQIETGSSWPLVLQHNLAHSRILIPVLSPEYFSSEWCAREMTSFLEREQVLGYRTPAKRDGLIFPVQLHDGDFYPDLVKDIQARPFRNYARREIDLKTTVGQAFEDAMIAWAPELCKVLSNAPPHDQSWTNFSGSGFMSQVHQTDPRYAAPPRINL